MKPPIGRVYVLSNKAMPGLLKIGYTLNTVEGRVKDLSSATGVPSEFVIEYQVECRDAAGVEALVHDSLNHSRHNNSREFFSISLAEAIGEIRKHAKEIIDEEFSENQPQQTKSIKTLVDYQNERNSISDWIEVKSLYWRLFITNTHLERYEDSLIFWQLNSVHSSKKMRSWQSAISKNRYYLENRTFEPIYQCLYFLPMCEGEIVHETLTTQKNFFPIPETLLSVVNNWK